MSFYSDPEKHDKIRLVVEIGSLHNRQPASKAAKIDIQKQLHGYMDLLGQEGERWDTTVLGLAILGTEVCFSRPMKFKNKQIGFTYNGQWDSLYGDRFVREMNRIAKAAD